MGLLWVLPYPVWGQMVRTQDQPVMQGVGMRFAADFHNYNRPQDYPLIDGTFSTFLVGVHYKKYFGNGIIEVGGNFIYKGGEDGFRLPVVMQDWPRDKYHTRFTAAELDLRVGPRIGLFFPKIGARLQYRFTQEGMVEDGFQGRPASDYQLNPVYLFLPLGVSLELPTSFGTTGIGAYYNFGITNVLSTRNLETGGTQRALTLEIHVMLRTD
ncbi:MAG: hypothetical protein KF690_01515 [Bacteroidetes bacterium]|nr:hypothetical protein [Bacteroidota bacterium]